MNPPASQAHNRTGPVRQEPTPPTSSTTTENERDDHHREFTTFPPDSPAPSQPRMSIKSSHNTRPPQLEEGPYSSALTDRHGSSRLSRAGQRTGSFVIQAEAPNDNNNSVETVPDGYLAENENTPVPKIRSTSTQKRNHNLAPTLRSDQLAPPRVSIPSVTVGLGPSIFSQPPERATQATPALSREDLLAMYMPARSQSQIPGPPPEPERLPQALDEDLLPTVDEHRMHRGSRHSADIRSQLDDGDDGGEVQDTEELESNQPFVELGGLDSSQPRNDVQLLEGAVPSQEIINVEDGSDDEVLREQPTAVREQTQQPEDDDIDAEDYWDKMYISAPTAPVSTPNQDQEDRGALTVEDTLPLPPPPATIPSEVVVPAPAAIDKVASAYMICDAVS
jgi:hypothetical protein